MVIKVFASGSSGNCYLVSDEKTSLLLDAGIPAREISKLSGYRLNEISACLVTHEHGDHCKAVNDLYMKYGVVSYLSKGTVKGADEHPWKIKVPVEICKAKEPLSIGTFVVQPFDVQHDAEEPLGFLLQSTESGERLLYFTDTYYLKYRFNHVNYIIGECNYVKSILEDNVKNGRIPPERASRTLRSHMSLEHLLEFLKANDLSELKQIYLAHISDANGNDQIMSDAVKKLLGVEVIVT